MSSCKVDFKLKALSNLIKINLILILNVVDFQLCHTRT